MKKIKRTLSAIATAGLALILLFSSCTRNGLPLLRQKEKGVIVYNGVTYVRSWKGFSYPPYCFPFQAAANVSGEEIGCIPIYRPGVRAEVIKYNENILLDRCDLEWNLWFKDGKAEFSAIEDYPIKSIEDRDSHFILPDQGVEITTEELINFGDEPITYFDLVDEDEFLTYDETDELTGVRVSHGWLNIDAREDIDIAMLMDFLDYNEMIYLVYYQKTEEPNKYLLTGYYKIKDEYQDVFAPLF